MPGRRHISALTHTEVGGPPHMPCDGGRIWFSNGLFRAFRGPPSKPPPPPPPPPAAPPPPNLQSRDRGVTNRCLNHNHAAQEYAHQNICHSSRQLASQRSCVRNLDVEKFFFATNQVNWLFNQHIRTVFRVTARATGGVWCSGIQGHVPIVATWGELERNLGSGLTIHKFDANRRQVCFVYVCILVVGTPGV